MFTSLAQWFQGHMLPCVYKQLFGIYCPMCGFQTSIISLLKGKYIESMTEFPALFPLLITFITYFLLSIIKNPKSKSTFQVMLLFDIIIMFSTCVYKNIH
jgi:hypothetical protein